MPKKFAKKSVSKKKSTKSTKKKPAKRKPRKKLSPYERNKIQWDKENAWIDAIILAYDHNIQYDYPIPDGYRICKVVRTAIDEIDVPKTFRSKILEVIWAPKDEYSKLECYIHRDYIFGSEWFYGYGALYRWREGQRKKAEERVKKYLPTRDKNDFKKLVAKIKITKDIKAFETDKVMEKLNDV